jgi:hypothetical protein
MLQLHYLVKALERGLIHRPLLLIYQMGKVGSQTIEATLRNALPGHLIYRPHYLSSQHVALVSSRLEFQILSDRAKDSVRQQIELANLLRHAVWVRCRLRTLLGIRVAKINIIAGVRDPVALMLSSIFQNHATYFARMEEIDTTACENLLLGRAQHRERQEHCAQMQRTIQEWFDAELKQIIGLDVYETTFPQETGYCIYENQVARVLVYRFENLESLQRMIEEFLGLKVPAILNENLSSIKEYARQYKDVRRELKLPDTFLQDQYNTKLTTHFYSKEERKQFAARWRGEKMVAAIN